MRKLNLFAEVMEFQKAKGFFLRHRKPGMDTGFDRTLLAIWRMQEGPKRRLDVFVFGEGCELGIGQSEYNQRYPKKVR
jgi:hypothetical protein